jgi:hypothetical protein
LLALAKGLLGPPPLDQGLVQAENRAYQQEIHQTVVDNFFDRKRVKRFDEEILRTHGA